MVTIINTYVEAIPQMSTSDIKEDILKKTELYNATKFSRTVHAYLLYEVKQLEKELSSRTH